MKRLLFLSFLFFGSLTVNAQDTLVTEDAFFDPSFFITILAGVILAISFQFVLTAISVAAGITAMGDLKENYVESQVEPSDKKSKDKKDKDSDRNPGLKTISAFGIWSLLTTSISLFGATALAFNLNVIESDPANITMALVIWALFFLIIFYIEAKSVNTLVGGLFSVATKGLRNAAETVQSALTPSKEAKVSKITNNTIESIRKKFDGSNVASVSDVIDKFFQKMDNRLPAYEKFKKDVEDITEESKSNGSSANWSTIQKSFVTALDKYGGEDESKINQIKNVYNDLKNSYAKGDNATEGMENVVADFSEVDKEQIEEKVQQLKNILKQAAPKDLNSGELERKINNFFEDPQIAVSIISNKVKDLDRDSIKKILASNTKLQNSEIDSFADKIESTIHTVISKFSSGEGNGQNGSFGKKIEDKVAEFLNSTNRQELNYGTLKQEVMLAIDNPKDSLSIVKNRLNQMDSETIKALISKNKYIDEEQVDTVTETLEDVRNTVADKITSIETKAREQYKKMERKAVIQAEHAREIGMAAAWWLVVSAAFSASAGMLGTLLH